MRWLMLLALMLVLPAAAQAEDTFVSEVGWAGSSASTADEWVELCGVPGADLSGWALEGAGTGGSTLSLPDGSAFSASGSFLIANFPADEARSTLDRSADWITSSIALSNTALALVLRDAGGTFVDAAGAAGEAPFAGSASAPRAAMQRLLPLGDGTLATHWASADDRIGFDATAEELGSPGTCPVIEAAVEEPPVEETQPLPETPVVSATSVEMTAGAEPAIPPTPLPTAPEPATSTARISEALPYPIEGGDEWIELVNLGTTADLLDGWTLEDGKGTVTKLSGTLLSWGHMLFIKPKGQLNNDGDLIVLKDALGRTIDAIAYGSWVGTSNENVGPVLRGEALMRLPWRNEWRITTQPTPGELNVLVEAVEEEPPPEQPVAATQAEEPSHAPAPPAPLATTTTSRATPIAKVAGVTAEAAPKVTSQSALKTTRSVQKPAPAKKAAATKYKGDAMSATILVPTGVYAKTRAYVLREGAIEELRFSKTPVAYAAGQELRFVAQRKQDGDSAYLLTNPNSVTSLATRELVFAETDALPAESGAVRLTASFVSKRDRTLTVRAGDEEIHVSLPTGVQTGSLTFGDVLEIEGFIDASSKRMVLASASALRVVKPAAPPAQAEPATKLPALPAVGLMLATGGVGMLAYLRQQRLQRAQVSGQRGLETEI